MEFAEEKRRLPIKRLAELLGENKWTLYKWAQKGSIPASKIAGLEHVCGRAFITEYLATSARKLVVDIPTGRLPASSDIHALQEACNAAIGALLDFAQGKADAAHTSDHLTAAMTLLAHERAQVERHEQPELNLQ